MDCVERDITGDGIRCSAHFPSATTPRVEALEKPDERINEEDPEKDFQPNIRESARESVVWSDVYLVPVVFNKNLHISSIKGTHRR